MPQNFNSISHLYQLNKLQIISIDGKVIDLNNMFVSVSIYENLFISFLMGEIHLIDDRDLIQGLPIIGGERLVFSVSSDTKNNSEFEFYIYKIGKDQSNTGDTAQKFKLLTLHFISKEGFKNMTNKVSKRYYGKAETVISSLLTTNLKSTFSKDFSITDNNIEIFANYWTPNQIIKFAVKNAESKKYSDYTFFQTLEKFQFKSISEMLRKDPVYGLRLQNIKSKFSRQDIQEFKFNSYFDHSKNTNSGVYGKINF